MMAVTSKDDSKGSPTSKETALKMLDNQETCTLATASADGVPEAATVRYVYDDDLNVYINTGSTYRKYQNMKENSNVAIVVNSPPQNLQLEGQAREVHDEIIEFIKTKYVDKYGRSKYLTNDESVFFEINTDWARLLVDGTFPPEHEMVIGDGDVDPHNEL
jgi:Pyridoxamine 5''-phosphate oxidase.